MLNESLPLSILRGHLSLPKCLTSILFLSWKLQDFEDFIFKKLGGFFVLGVHFWVFTRFPESFCGLWPADLLCSLYFYIFHLGWRKPKWNPFCCLHDRYILILVFLEWIVCFSLFEFDATFYDIIYRWFEKSLISINFVPLQMEPKKSIVFKRMLVVDLLHKLAYPVAQHSVLCF